ncbi:MAG: hypothetical protein Q9165_008687 [Trypethelium subeluteriae]
MEGPINNKDIEKFEEVPLGDEDGRHSGTPPPSYEDSRSATFWEAINPRKVWVESPGSGRLVLAVGFSLLLCVLLLIIGAPVYAMLNSSPTLRDPSDPSDPNSAANKVSMLLPRGHSYSITLPYFEETAGSTYSPIRNAILPESTNLILIPRTKVVSDGNAAVERDSEIQGAASERAGRGDGDMEASQGVEKQAKGRTNNLKSHSFNGKPQRQVGLAAIVIAVGSTLLGVTFVILGVLVCYLERKERRDISNA